MNAEHGYGFTPTRRYDTYPGIDPLRANLIGRKVLITGAARGLGREIALSFVKAGTSAIAVIDLLDFGNIEQELVDAATGAGRARPDVIMMKCDITQFAMVKHLTETVRTEWGSVDIVINNAGYLAPYEPLGDSDPEKWWRNFEVNVKGVYMITKLLLPLVLESKEKTFIVMSSVGALHTLPGGSGYETTKLAVLKINDYLMAEYGNQGLLAYAVAPGGVKTAMAQGFPDELQHLLSDTPQLVADTITFLTSERRTWLAARYVDSRWDMIELLKRKEEVVERDLLKVKLRI